MPNIEHLSRQWNQLAAKIAALGPIRPGTICSQKVKYRAKDGSLKQNGPYLILTSKEGGKTRTVRLRSPEEIEIVEKQIENFRSFQILTKELIRIGKELADCEMGVKTEGKKNSSSASGSSKKKRPRRSSSE
jgi:hypothetical protein